MVRRLVPAVVAMAIAFGAGVRVGATYRPPAPTSRIPCVAAIVEDLEDAEKLGGAAVQIINEMVMGRASSDETSMVFLRDSMQEMTAGLGNVRSEIEALSSQGRLPRCRAARSAGA
jgi:hypothetical protein